MKRAAAILNGELRNMVREPELSFLLLAPFLIGLVLRLGLPKIEWFLDRTPGFELDTHLPFLMGCMMLVPPLLSGMVVGLRLIDDRDAGVLNYIAVTPPSTGGYLLVRLALPALVSIPLTAMLPYMEGRFTPAVGSIVLIAVVSSLNAPLLALFLGAFAGNKVEAMALVKVSGILFVAPLAGYIWRSPVVWSMGVIPLFWPPLAAASIDEGRRFFLLLIAGTVIQLVWLSLFWRLFRRRQFP